MISAHARRIETAFLSSASSGQGTGVLSSSFPASLMLQTAAATILDTLAKQEVEGGRASNCWIQIRFVVWSKS